MSADRLMLGISDAAVGAWQDFRDQMHSSLTLVVPPVAAPVYSHCLRRQHLPALLPTIGHGPPVTPRVDLQHKATVA